MFALQQRLQLRHNQVFLYLKMTKDHLELLVDELNNIAQIELLDPNKKLHQTIILYAQYSAACWESHRQHESDTPFVPSPLPENFKGFKND